MKCHYCGQEIDDGSLFCGYCGEKQPKVMHCIKCGQEIGLDDAFCGFCGASQTVEMQDVAVDGDEQEALEVVQASDNESIGETKADVISQNQEVEAIDDANEKRNSKEEQIKSTISTEQKDKELKEEKHVKETVEDNGNKSSESTPTSLDEDNSSNNTKKFIIIALIAALVIFGGYLFFFNKSDSDIANTWAIENKDISLLDEEQNNSAETNDSSTDFATKHISFKQSSKEAETSIEIDYPMSGNTKLVVAIRNFILETLVNTYTWDDPMPKYTGDVSNGQAVADFYGKTKMKMLKKECRDKNISIQICEDISINIKKETMKFVTYEVSFGGYHGWGYDETSKGITFMKKNGKQLIIFKNKNDEELKQLVIRYVKDYFGSDTDDLLESFYEKPMPSEPPTLSFNGITFIYQKYEIASGAMGSPSITIPFDELDRFLTDDAKEVVRNN